jgi:hypothetical protein
MIEIDENTFRTAFSNAAPEIKKQLDYNKVHKCLVSSLPLETEPTDVNIFVALVGYHVLGVIDQKKTIEEISTFKVPKPELFLQKVLDCLKENEPKNVVLDQSAQSSTPVIAEKIVPANQNAPLSPHIRTMAADMTKSQNSGERVYSSTQEAILKEGWSAPKQTPPPPTTGSWG